MYLEIQVQPDGGLRFVDQTGQTITILGHQDVVLLLSLAHHQTKPVVNELPVLGYARLNMSKNQLVRRPLARSVGAAYTWQPNISTTIKHLEALNLVTVSGPRAHPLHGITAEVSAYGARLARWLRHGWPGWPGYAQQFPM